MNNIKTPYGTFDISVEKSPVDERDYLAETIFADGELPEEFSLVSDLRPVRNQGNYGTCAAQTAACMKELEEYKDYGFTNYMSPQFVYNNRVNSATTGMFARDVMNILKKKGICTEEEYPYETFDKISDNIYESAKKHIIKEYASVSTIDALKKAIYLNGPCYIAVPVFNYGGRMWKPEQGDRRLGGHAMAVIGWNKDGFIIRNSWGDKWNDDGYTIFPYEDWGLQWEIWSTVDEKSKNPFGNIKKKNIFHRFFSWVAGLFKI